MQDLPELCKGSAGFNCRLAAREVLTMLMVSLLNHEYCLGSRSGCERPKHVPGVAIQYHALVMLTTAAEMMFLHCPIEIGSKDWESNLKCARLNYGGSGGGVAEGVTARQN